MYDNFARLLTLIIYKILFFYFSLKSNNLFIFSLHLSKPDKLQELH